MLPLWRQYAAILHTWGFSVWARILNAADYGVPQTRRRAILLASRTRTAEPSPPTHAKTAEPQSLFGPGRKRWVSMAVALGWEAIDRPVPTVCAGGGPEGGPEPFPSGSRKTLTDARDRSTWTPRPGSGVVLQSRREGAGRAQRHGTREKRSAVAPALAFTAEEHHWSWSLRSNNQANATVRSLDEPAGTLFFGHRANECTWLAEPAHDSDGNVPAPDPIRITAQEAGVLQSFPAGYPWQGNKGQRYSQIGNAVPARLAAHLLAPHLGKTLTADDITLAA